MSDDYLENLVSELSNLPGVGQRTAERLAFYILGMQDNEALSLSNAIKKAKENIKFCSICGSYTSVDPCEICRQENSSISKIIVVESPRDKIIMDKIKDEDVFFHVLHGAISPLNNVRPEDLNIKSLLLRLQKNKEIKEVIIATNLSIEGEATAMYIANLLKDTGITITRIAAGVSVGSELEYTDQLTLKKAIEARVKI
ncbi:MAG: recombination mediator RecR [Clostridiales Family XIII bacterium]|jgi:recombination protein RecR|nr:recombination mediator RecR [Clostridiales Family XIII bacterium]